MNWVNLILIGITVTGVVIAGTMLFFNSHQEAIPTIQYTQPIGPTQAPPYILESQVLPTKEVTMSG